MPKKLVITEYDSRILSMLLEDGRETRIELYGGEESVLDNIYVARVRDLAPGIGAAFVETAPGSVCYFSLKENPRPVFLNRKKNSDICQGDLLLVQIKKAGAGTKAPTASCKICLTGSLLALTAEQPGRVGISRKIKDDRRSGELKSLIQPFVNDEYGFIVRTDAQFAREEEILSELEALRGEYEELLARAASRPAFTCMKKAVPPLIRDIFSYKMSAEDEIVTDIAACAKELAGFFTEPPVRLYEDSELALSRVYDIRSRLEAALKPRVWLKSGGYLVIESTEALTVIDVNTGKSDGTGKDRERTFLSTNLEACGEIARQLILRNISGIIIIDFISLGSSPDRALVEKKMKSLLAADPVRAVFVEFTKLDLMEITRKKIKRPLYEAVKKEAANEYYENN